MLAFVTVGSTQFDSLVNRVLSDAILSALRDRGYTKLVVQCGNSEFAYAHLLEPETRLEQNGVSIELWKFKPSLQEEYERADLVVSHAGIASLFDRAYSG